MRKLKVMHLILSMETGGTQTRIAYLANHLDKERFDFSICCFERIGNVNYPIDEGVKIFLMHKKPGIAFLLPLRLGILLAREKIDIVHTHGFNTNFYGVPAAVLARIPVIIHGEMGDIFREVAKKRFLVTRRFLSFFVNWVLVNSNGLKETVKKLTHTKEAKFKVIYNGVDAEKFKKFPQRAEYFTTKNGEDVIVGSVGRIIAWKNHEALLRAMSLVRKEDHRVKAVIVGDGVAKPRLEQVVSELGLEDCVRLLGRREDVASLLNTFDIFALPSFAEGCSNALLEAMSCGLPIIASDTIGNRELVEDGVTGILFSLDNIRSFAEAILSLAQDRAKREKMSQEARKRVEEVFSLDKMLEKYRDLYLEEARRCIKQ